MLHWLSDFKPDIDRATGVIGPLAAESDLFWFSCSVKMVMWHYSRYFVSPVIHPSIHSIVLKYKRFSNDIVSFRLEDCGETNTSNEYIMIYVNRSSSVTSILVGNSVYCFCNKNMTLKAGSRPPRLICFWTTEQQYLELVHKLNS